MRRGISKFRGRKIDTSEWLVGSHFFDGAEDYIIPNTLLGLSNFEDYQVDLNTIGEWTGWIDIEGKDIYEGDIVEFQRVEFYVIWSQELASFILKALNIEAKEIVGLKLDRKLKITGNVYENNRIYNK